MVPLRGWAPKGARLRGFAPHGHWRTMTFLGALRCDRLTAPCVFDGPINGECFRAYVEQLLVPCLRPGDIVIMDNLGSHKSAELRRIIRLQAQGGGICRPTHQTSTQSSKPSPDQALDAPGPETHRRRTLRHIGDLISQIQAPECTTTSPTLDTLQSNCETL